MYFCSRGSSLILPDGRRVLFAGGADSMDKNQRIIGHDWFAEENISERQFRRMSTHAFIDIIISHTCPDSFEVHGSEGKYNDSNRVALDSLLGIYRPSLWYFGHWHKYQSGMSDNTCWTCLDYPKHNGGRWWQWLKTL